MRVPWVVAFGSLQPLVCSSCGAPLQAADSQALLRCGYCQTTHRFVKPPPPEPEVEWSPGERTVIEWGGRWWSGKVLHKVRPGVWLVHYDGWGNRWNEEVEASRLRHPRRGLVPVQGNGVGLVLAISAGFLVMTLAVAGFVTARQHSPSASTHEQAPDPAGASDPSVTTAGQDTSADRAFRSGQAVQIHWGSSWYKGRILRVEGKNRYLVHYDGYSASWDEVVGPERLKAP